MVCSFCPALGTAYEKSFNRVDLFKRHLSSVHGVEQTPPNSRKPKSKSATPAALSAYYSTDATGKCTICPAIFDSAQEFYEHLDPCVLEAIRRDQDAINSQLSTTIDGDEDVQETLERHLIGREEFPRRQMEDEGEDEDEDDDDDALKSSDRASESQQLDSDSVALVRKDQRKKKKVYPSFWGMAQEKINLKKRVLSVYDMERRLFQDDNMLTNEFETRIPLPDGRSYVTDLDVEALKRAAAIHAVSEFEGADEVGETDEFDLSALMA